jgi:hypothetical protein
MTAVSSQMAGSGRNAVRKRELCAVLSAVIFALTGALYVQTRDFEFINFDDEFYVTNAVVTNGLTAATVQWAFTGATEATGNWHPLTMLSLMADVSLFGVHSGAMHLHNAVLHALNAVLVFWLLAFLVQVSGSKPRQGDGPLNLKPIFAAAFAGSLFWSLHPLRVESVAWVSSRKDVLCVFWYLLGTLTYLRHAGRGACGFWLVPVTLLFYLAAVMSKPTAIVFPGTLFLAEYLLFRRIPWRRVAVFGGATLFFVEMTMIAQKAAMLTERYPLSVRLQNAAASVSHYTAATLWPKELSVFYPYEDPVPFVWFISGVALLAGLAWFIVIPLSRRIIQDAWKHEGGSRTPGIAHGRALVTLGILWFFMALIPVIGLIHVGEAAHADRYTYLSGIGWSILLAAFVSSCGSRFSPVVYRPLLLVCVAAVTGLSLCADRYIGVWRDSVTLFTHARSAVPDNHVAECNLGAACFHKKDSAGALNHYLLMVAQRGCDHGSVVLLEYVLWKIVKDENPEIATPKNILELTVLPGEPEAAAKTFALACIAYDRELYLAAERNIIEYLRLNPGDGYAWEVYARILLAQERYGDALEKAQKAQKFLPRRAATKKLLRQIQALCAQPIRKEGQVFRSPSESLKHV